MNECLNTQNKRNQKWVEERKKRHTSSNSIYVKVHDQVILDCIAGAQIDPGHTVHQITKGHEKCVGHFEKFLFSINVIFLCGIICHSNKLLLSVYFIVKYYMSINLIKISRQT